MIASDGRLSTLATPRVVRARGAFAASSSGRHACVQSSPGVSGRVVSRASQPPISLETITVAETTTGDAGTTRSERERPGRPAVPPCPVLAPAVTGPRTRAPLMGAWRAPPRLPSSQTGKLMSIPRRRSTDDERLRRPGRSPWRPAARGVVHLSVTHVAAPFAIVGCLHVHRRSHLPRSWLRTASAFGARPPRPIVLDRTPLQLLVLTIPCVDPPSETFLHDAARQSSGRPSSATAA